MNQLTTTTGKAKNPGAFFETERLRLRAFTMQDADFIIELLNTPGWIQFIGDRNVKTRIQAERYLENGPMKSYEQHGFGLSMVERREDLCALGMCGIIWRETLEWPDIGFAFLPEYGGRGYALEIAKATLQYGLDVLMIPRIAAITVPHNLRSVNLLEKIGLRFKEDFRMAGSEEELKLFLSDFRGFDG